MYIVIIGAGEVGYNLAKMLSYEHHDIVLIEVDQDRIKRAQEHIDAQIIQGDGCSFSVLKRAGLQKADMLVAVSNKDEINLLVCQIAHKFGVKKKIARVRNPEFTAPDAPLSAEDLHIDMIIHPDSEVAHAVVNLLKQSAATDIVEFADGGIVLVGIQLDRECTILRKKMLDLAGEHQELQFRVVAILRRDRTIIPGGDDILMANDRVFFMTRKENVDEVVRLAGKEKATVNNVMILGGGQTGATIAHELEDELNVKIIESNVDKSDRLAENLDRALVIRGDGRDLNLLALEGIIDMDAFIAVTGDDETNIISSLMAKHLQVPRIISLINKTDYTPIIPTIGIDAYISKQMVTVDNILKFIRRGSIVSVASIPGIAAEAIEFIAGEHSKITRKPLMKLGLPKGAILGAVQRNGDVFIPVGSTVIEAGDKVVTFVIPASIREIEKLFN